MPASPLCLVADGVGPFLSTFPDGLDINPGDTVSIKLQSPSGASGWYLQIGLVLGNPPVVIPGTGLDEVTVSPPTLTGVNGAGLVIAGPTATVTFVFPNTLGTTLLFSSTVTGGFGSITTTFALFSRTVQGYRVGATGMSREGSNSYGWTSIINPAIRHIGSGGGGVSAVTASSPIASSGGPTPNITFTIAGEAPGDLVYLSSTGWTRIPKGAAGDFLQTSSTGPDYTPSWVTAVTSVGASSPIASSGGPTPTISFSIASQTQGDIVYFNGTNWVRLPAGISGQFLKTLGGAADPQWATVSGGPVGDNADAVRMGPDRPFLMDGQSTTLDIQIRNTLLNTVGASYSGADLVISERRLLFTGRSGITFAQLYSMDLAGYQMGLDFDLTTSIATLTNPYALIGMGVDQSHFITLAIGNAGAVSNYIYESIHSTPADGAGIIWTAGAEDWSGARACYVYTTQRNGTYGNNVEVFFTAPLADKFYQGNIYNDTGDPFGYTFTGETPTGICAAGDNNFWVSFVGSGKLRRYQVNTPGPTYPTITQVGTDVSVANVVELLFDGKYLWALSTAGANGTIYKLSADGTVLDSVAFTTGITTTRSRMCFDGTSIWITRGTVVTRIFPEGSIAVQQEFLTGVLGTEARGIVCDPIDKTVYIAIGHSDVLYIHAWIPPTGELWRVRERQATWRTGVNSMPTTFTAVDIGSQTIACSRQFEFTIGASQISGGTAKAAWKKYVAVDDDGTNMTIIGSVADIVPPMLNAGAITDGFDVTVSSTGTHLQVSVTQGTLGGGLGVNWTIAIKETRSFAGVL